MAEGINFLDHWFLSCSQNVWVLMTHYNIPGRGRGLKMTFATHARTNLSWPDCQAYTDAMTPIIISKIWLMNINVRATGLYPKHSFVKQPWKTYIKSQNFTFKNILYLVREKNTGYNNQQWLTLWWGKISSWKVRFRFIVDEWLCQPNCRQGKQQTTKFSLLEFFAFYAIH